MTTTDQAVTAARRLARSAAVANAGVTSCPYPDGGPPVQQAARRAWLREYLHRRPPQAGAVSYDDTVTELAAGPDSPDDGKPAPVEPAHLLGGAGQPTAERVVVDDAGDVVLAEGWAPPVPDGPVTVQEARSDRKLRAYWVRGEGAAKIGWGHPGDFAACVTHLGKYVKDPEGLCAEYHHAATGEWPGKDAHGGK